MTNKAKVKVILDSVILVSAFLAKTKEELSATLFPLCMVNGILHTSEEILEETR